MNIPTISGARGIFALFAPGVFLLLNIIAFIYLLPWTDDQTKKLIVNSISSPAQSLLVVFIFGYLIGSLLRLIKAPLADSWSAFCRRVYRKIRPIETSEKLPRLPADVKFPEDLKDKIRYDKSEQLLFFKGLMSKEEKDKLLNLSTDDSYNNAIKALFADGLYLTEEFPYMRLIEKKCSTHLPDEASEFYEKTWAKKKEVKHNRQFFNFHKNIINAVNERSANEIYAAEALTRYIAGMFYALILAFFLILATIILHCIYPEITTGTPTETLTGNLTVTLVAIEIAYFIAIGVISFNLRLLRIKEVDVLFAAHFINHKKIEDEIG